MMDRFWNALLSVCFPSHCLLCDSFVEDFRSYGVCPACWKRVSLLPLEVCQCCGLPSSGAAGSLCGKCLSDPPAFEKARAAALYQEELRDLIHRFKFNGFMHLSKPLGKIMQQVFPIHFDAATIDIIVPVPLHAKREKQRGFNQAELLARSLANHLKKPLASRVLRRSMNTPPQSGLTDAQRLENVKGVFEVRKPAVIEGKQVLLVDDVLTTGATLSSCARVLKSSGAIQVHVFTLARVPSSR